MRDTMNDRQVYFRDNFFYRGVTDIFGVNQHKIGELDFGSIFSSEIKIKDNEGNLVCVGDLGFWAGWIIRDGIGNVICEVGQPMFATSKYVVELQDKHRFKVRSSPNEPSHFEVLDDRNELSATIKLAQRMTHCEFELENLDFQIPTLVLVSVAIGIRTIEKRDKSNP